MSCTLTLYFKFVLWTYMLKSLPKQRYGLELCLCRPSIEALSDYLRLLKTLYLWPPWVVAGAYLKALLACSSMPYIIINFIILTFCSNMFSKMLQFPCNFFEMVTCFKVLHLRMYLTPNFTGAPSGNPLNVDPGAYLKTLERCNFISTKPFFRPRPFCHTFNAKETSANFPISIRLPNAI